MTQLKALKRVFPETFFYLPCFCILDVCLLWLNARFTTLIVFYRAHKTSVAHKLLLKKAKEAENISSAQKQVRLTTETFLTYLTPIQQFFIIIFVPYQISFIVRQITFCANLAKLWLIKFIKYCQVSFSFQQRLLTFRMFTLCYNS